MFIIFRKVTSVKDHYSRSINVGPCSIEFKKMIYTVKDNNLAVGIFPEETDRMPIIVFNPTVDFEISETCPDDIGLVNF